MTNDGQPKSSIAPTFSKRGYNYPACKELRCPNIEVIAVNWPHKVSNGATLLQILSVTVLIQK